MVSATQGRVAVIGAGPLGLMTLKELQEQGFTAVTGFEARTHLGGLWKDTVDSRLSVQAHTVFNTSKFRAAISDFPFPEEADVFPTAEQIYDYLNSYADHFDIRRRIRLQRRVRRIVREKDRWALEVEDTATDQGDTRTEYFDRVCVATGSFQKPRWPVFPGIEKFAGTVLHSIDFHDAAPFRGQNVLLVGMHATAQDVTVALAPYAKQLYLSHRHGLLMIPRFTPEGHPVDCTVKLPVLMIQRWMTEHIPSLWVFMIDRALASMSDKAYPSLPESWGMRPAPSVAVSSPLLADQLWPHLESGFAEPVAAIEEVLGPKSVRLTSGRILKDVDAIIYCTGYHVVLPDDLIPRPAAGNDDDVETSYDPYPDGPGGPARLYRGLFPLSSDEAVRNTLAFIGQGAVLYPAFLQFELQAMAVAQVWRGRHALPPLAEMRAWHARYAKDDAATRRRYGVPESFSTLYPGVIPLSEQLPWLDAVAGTAVFPTFGGYFRGLFNPRAWGLWWRDRALYRLCTDGIPSPILFRIFETGRRNALGEEAGRAMLKLDNEIYERAVLLKRRELGLDTKGKARTV